MQSPQRNQLVWLTEPAWQAVLARDWDAQALAILRHWHAKQLPLVVCRQRGTEQPQTRERVSLGLPAPNQWERRKLALDVALEDVARIGDFPLVKQVLNDTSLLQGGEAQLQSVMSQAQALGVHLRVYGSYGWQSLSGLPCVREASDLDLLAPVQDLATAAQVAQLLQGLQLGPRVDGELLFPNGWAIAWREYAQLLSGQVDRVLVKQREGVQLLTMAELRSHLPDPVSKQLQSQLHSIARQAVRALYAELALEPKPGLVSFRDNGSHTDMQASTFVKSLFALRHYFGHIARAGAEAQPFEKLQALGIAAEVRMLKATGGINTHRGAVFALGLLCAAAGRLAALQQPCTAAAVRACLMAQWGPALRQRADAAAKATPISNGQRVARALGLKSAGDEAALGFPTLFTVTLPTLQHTLQRGHAQRAARVQALFATMAVLDDTNTAHRGGKEGALLVKDMASAFLQAGGVNQTDWLTQARAVHAAYVAQRLSPGGSADVLAAAVWLHAMEQGADAMFALPVKPEAALEPAPV